MSPITTILLYCALIIAASLAGGFLPNLLRLTHTQMQVLMSFVGGLMLGVALLYLLPHAINELGSVDTATIALLTGLLAMFFLIRIFHVHQHASPEETSTSEDHTHDPLVSSAEDCHLHQHRFSWIGLALGLGLHTILDGVALAASVVAASHVENAGLLLGMGTFVAILLHKPLDALSITTVMRAGGWSARATLLVNLGFALTCPLGALAFYLGTGTEQGTEQVAVGLALGAAAGVFLCIALADILPELRFHSHDRLKLSLALLLGVLLAYAVSQLEPSHSHHPPHKHVSIPLEPSSAEQTDIGAAGLAHATAATPLRVTAPPASDGHTEQLGLDWQTCES
jgi:zinc and cadmium transporter